jgi:two-component system, LytTR family, response regulator
MTSATPLRVLVVDDEAPARRKILRLLRGEPDAQIVAEADSGDAAIAEIEKHEPDLVFLDVQMPGTDGFAVVQAVSAQSSDQSGAQSHTSSSRKDAALRARSNKTKLPQFVFVTAHDQYALRAFEVHAFDYLLKPIAEDRFREALNRARVQHQQSNAASADARLQHLLQQIQRERGYSQRLLIREGERAFFVSINDISWIEADRNYVFVHTAGKKHNIRGTLDSLQEILDPKLFVRLNRGSLVRLDAIRELQPWFHGEYKVILRDNTELRWSRRYVTKRPELLKLP